MGKNVIILGAGPTGLSCAWRLTENNIPVQVIEKEELVGGVSATFNYQDMSLDLGPHRFTPHTKEVLSLVQKLCGDDLKLMAQHIEIYLRGKYFNYPLRAMDLAASLSPLAPVKFFTSYLLIVLRQLINPRPEKSYEDWVTRRFGRAIYNLVFQPIARKTWGLEPTQISATIARQRISLPSLAEIIVDLLREILRLKKKNVIINPLYPEGYFYYPQKGIGQICDTMAEKIKSSNGQIMLNTRPQSIQLEGNRVKAIEINGAQTKTDFLMSTIPLPELISLITPAPEEKVRRAAEKLEFQSIILLFLVVNKDKISDNIAIFFPEEDFIFGRIGEQKNFSPQTVPAGKTALCVEITAREGDGVWEKDDAFIFNRIIPDLEKINLLKREDVTRYFSRRLKYTYPLYDIDFEERLSTVLNYVEGIENLITNGRPGLFKYNNLHHSLEMGLLAAQHILSGKAKAEEWQNSLAIFENYRMIE